MNPDNRILNFILIALKSVILSLVWVYLLIYVLERYYTIQLLIFIIIPWSTVGSAILFFLSRKVIAEKFWKNVIKLEAFIYIVLFLFLGILYIAAGWEQANCDQLRDIAASSGAHMSAFLCPTPIHDTGTIVVATILLGPTSPIFFISVFYIMNRFISKP